MTDNSFGKTWRDVISSAFGNNAQDLTKLLERPSATEAGLAQEMRQQRLVEAQRIAIEQERSLLFGAGPLMQQALSARQTGITGITSLPSGANSHIAIPSNAVEQGRIYVSQVINGQTEVCVIIPKRLLITLNNAYRRWVDTPDYSNPELAMFEEAVTEVLEAGNPPQAPTNPKAPQQPPNSLTPTESIIDKFIGGDIPYA